MPSPWYLETCHHHIYFTITVSTSQVLGNNLALAPPPPSNGVFNVALGKQAFVSQPLAAFKSADKVGIHIRLNQTLTERAATFSTHS